MKIGIDMGGSHVAIGIVNENGKIIEKFEKDNWFFSGSGSSFFKIL